MTETPLSHAQHGNAVALHDADRVQDVQVVRPVAEGELQVDGDHLEQREGRYRAAVSRTFASHRIAS